MADLVENLSRVPLFAGVDHGKLEKLAAQMADRTFSEGESATEEGRGGSAFWIIESGEATVAVKGEVVRTLGPGDYFGEISLLDEGVRTATVTAATDLRCHGMAPWEFRAFVDQNPDAAWAMMRGLVTRLRESEERSGD
ncbi:MAG: cyclic nucleotide-binding domain-containing protein [Solirubrobacterales bacterium]